MPHQIPNIPAPEASNGIETTELYDPMPVDYFQPFLDPQIFNSEASFLAFDQFETPQYTDQFDMWLGGNNFTAQAPGVVES